MKDRMSLTAVSVFLLVVSALCLLPPARRARAHDGTKEPLLLEVGGETKGKTPDVPAELKVVSYNIRYRAGEDLKQLARLLKEDPDIGGAQVIGLQEVDRNKRRTGNVNTARQLAEELGMRYAWAAPPSTDEEEEETGVAILSVFPLKDVTRVLLKHEGPEGRRRVAVGATVQLGKTRVRVYSVHAETRMPVEKKVEHWQAVLEDLRLHAGTAAIVLGDFNTIKGKDVKAARRLFTDAGFRTPLSDDETTWKTFVVQLKLDWLWLRGLEARSSGIDKDVDLSDHWPLWATIRLPAPTSAKP
ncbi:MAG: endonuclease/exonuclease/phosphatase family protein [Acidobacteria bacterium]|nr:endonuclease/exonuclease/phosphatase family protein [Acidobacteriota bacterium]MBV9927844.1 endonuclease/exonuclease/phosphatase family protein [Acidobacteriota bacterium]